MQSQAILPPPHNVDEISLAELARPLWRRRLMISGLVGFGALLGLAGSLASERYVSKGYLTTNISIATYKRYEAAVSSGAQLAQFLREGGAENAVASTQLLELADESATLGKVIRLEASFTEKDVKTFGRQDDQKSTLLFHLRHESRTPVGSAPLVLLGEFVRDVIIRIDMDEIIPRKCNDERSLEQTLRNSQIKNEFDIRQEEERAATLRKLAASHGNAQDHAIVMVDKDSKLFLSLPKQLAATEIQIANMRLADARREREHEASMLRRDYYCKAQQILQAHRRGRAFLAELDTIQQSIFEGKGRSDIVEQTWNELELERRNWINTYLTIIRFIMPPDDARREYRIGIIIGVALGASLGGVFGVLWALGMGWRRGS